MRLAVISLIILFGVGINSSFSRDIAKELDDVGCYKVSDFDEWTLISKLFMKRSPSTNTLFAVVKSYENRFFSPKEEWSAPFRIEIGKPTGNNGGYELIIDPVNDSKIRFLLEHRELVAEPGIGDDLSFPRIYGPGAYFGRDCTRKTSEQVNTPEDEKEEAALKALLKRARN